MSDMMNLEEWLFDKEITPDILVKTYGFRQFRCETITRVNSVPKKVEFGGGLFAASFVFSENQLHRITLIPIIKGVKEPNYPTEEYQEIQMNDCADILRRMFGKPVDANDVYKRWETERYKISCSKSMIGKGKYTGGNIIIRVRQL